MLGIASFGNESGLVDSRIEPGLSIAEDLPGEMVLGWGENGVPVLQLQRRLCFGGIAVDDSKPVQ